MISRALITGDPDAVTRQLPMLMLPAMLGLFLCSRFDVPGGLSCFHLAAFAASAAVFHDFRAERGLWMLATLFFVVWSSISLLWLYGEVQDALRGVAPEVTLMADAAIATSIMHGHTRYLGQLIRRNFSISGE